MQLVPEQLDALRTVSKKNYLANPGSAGAESKIAEWFVPNPASSSSLASVAKTSSSQSGSS